MRTLKLFIFIFFFGLSLSACQQETRFRDLKGNTILFSEFRNKWLIINYWAIWCKPCHQEMPELNAFSQQKNVALFGVSYDKGTITELNTWAKKLNIQFPVLTSDPATTFGIESIPGLPTTVIISPEGKVTKLLFGPQTIKNLQSSLQN